MKVTIATGKKHISSIRNQLGDLVNIYMESCQRDIFLTISLSADYLRDIQKLELEEPVVICLVDAYMEQPYFQALKWLGDLTTENAAIGMEPAPAKIRVHYTREQGDC